jgi:hypothetical protein
LLVVVGLLAASIAMTPAAAAPAWGQEERAAEARTDDDVVASAAAAEELPLHAQTGRIQPDLYPDLGTAFPCSTDGGGNLLLFIGNVGGDAPSSTTAVRFTLFDEAGQPDDARIEEVETPALRSGGGVVLLVELPDRATDIENPPYEVEVVADFYMEVGELDEENNFDDALCPAGP